MNVSPNEPASYFWNKGSRKDESDKLQGKFSL